MGTYCTSFAEKKNEAGEWEVIFEDVFPTQHYMFFGWLGNKSRNYSKIPPIGIPTKLRKESALEEDCNENVEYIFPADLFINFDYYQRFEDRQMWVNDSVAAHCSIPDDETGMFKSYFLAFGYPWLDMVDKLKENNIERIRFYYT